MTVEDTDLDQKYPLPENSDIINEELISDQPLTQYNYVSRMHQFLYLEEKEKTKTVSKYATIEKVMFLNFFLY